jgi:spore coat protein A, manganese oxidase
MRSMILPLILTAIWGACILSIAVPISAMAQPGDLPGIPDDRFLSPIADPNAIPKFTNLLPVVRQLGIRMDAVAKTNFTIKAAPCTQDMLGDGHMTKLLGFAVDNFPVTHPGATIVAKKNVPITVNWVNDLGFSYPIPIDTSVMWAFSDPPYWGRTIANNGVPFVPHLHGAHTDAIYDGLPDQWWTPLYHTTSNPLAKGKDFVTNVYTYDNSQEAATLWYHDHSHGITRLQAYMGMAGFYFVRDDNELSLIASHLIPSGDQEIELAIQDKVFWPNGQLAIPNVSRSSNPTEIILPEFFGNVICVNGKAWPKLSVDPRQYRFRILNGSDSRFYNMWLEADDAPGVRIPFKQIGTEDGFLPSPVAMDKLLVGCGERYDIVVDFSGYAGKKIIVKNDAGTPYANMTPDPVDPATTGLVMRFDVSTAVVADPVHLPANLRAPIVPLVQTGPTRQLILAEMEDGFGRTMPMLGTVADGKMMYMDPVTENIKLNDVETWQIYNTTMDGHPMHLHLVAFQVVSRQAYTATQDPITKALTNIQLQGSAQSMPPELQGWKDTQVMYPGEVTTLRAKFDKPGMYVWHCHILSHEEYDMMRPFYVRHTLVAPALAAPINLGTGIVRTTALLWNPVLDAAAYTIQIATNPSFSSPVVNQAGIVPTTFKPASQLAANMVYYWRVCATNVDGAGPWSDVFSFTTDRAGAPAHFIFTGNTGKNSTVVLPNTADISLDGIPIVSGDEIGVFNASSLCVGAIVWNGTTTEITVWGDNTVTPGINGMIEGDTLYFRLWKQSKGLEYIATTPVFSSGNGVFSDGASSVIRSLTTLTYPLASHCFIIPPGWNMVSTYVRPAQAAIDSIAQPFVDNLVLIKNGSGQVFWPALGVRSLTSWNNAEGYQVYMAHGDTAAFNGVIEQPETKPISLLSGWNMVGYLRYSPQAPVASFTSIASRLVVAKDNFGQVYWPAYGINTIGSLVPGQGYQLYLSSASTLTYPANDVLTPNCARAIAPAPRYAASTNHFTPSFSKTGASATILLRFKEDVADMDEVAVRTLKGDYVGTGSIENKQAILTLWGDDAATPAVDGATEGETLSLSYWSASGKVEKYLTITSLTDGANGKALGTTLVYQTDAISIADVSMGVRIPTSVASLGSIPTDFVLEQNYPNPFNPATTIVYGLPREARVSLDVYNVVGQKVGTIVDEVKSAGYHEASFDASHLTSGIYIYRLTAGSFVQVKKMLLVR